MTEVALEKKGGAGRREGRGATLLRAHEKRPGGNPAAAGGAGGVSRGGRGGGGRGRQSLCGGAPGFDNIQDSKLYILCHSKSALTRCF